MKNRTLILVFLIMAVLIIAGSCATDPMKYISKDYEIYGTWTNPDVNEKRTPAKVVYYPNDKIEAYARETNTFEQFTGKWYPQHYLTTIDNIN